MTTTTKSPSTPRPLLLGLIGVLAVWGIYQTVGATGWFTDKGLFDARRSIIVFACSGAFVAWWIWLLRSLRQAAPTDPGTGDALLTNYASVVSLGMNLAAWPLWVFAASAWQQNPENGLTMPLGWLALSLFGIGAVLALIGLSDTRRRRFQLAGLATVLLLIVAVIAFFVRAASLAGQ